jgi:hypothetical protein
LPQPCPAIVLPCPPLFLHCNKAVREAPLLRLAVQPVRPCRICRFGIRPSKTDAYIDLQQIALLLLLLVGNGWQQGKSGGLPSGKTALQGVENQWITIGWMYWSR